MTSQKTDDEYKIVGKCVPLSKKARFQGIWLVGYETSIFKPLPIDKRDEHDLVGYNLTAPNDVVGTIGKPQSMHPFSYDVSFIGRKSLLPWTAGGDIMVMDKLISMRRIQESPAGATEPSSN
jgi:hypothetical protein